MRYMDKFENINCTDIFSQVVCTFLLMFFVLVFPLTKYLDLFSCFVVCQKIMLFYSVKSTTVVVEKKKKVEQKSMC